MGISQRIQRNPALLLAVGCALIVLAVVLAALSIRAGRSTPVEQSQVEKPEKKATSIIIAKHSIERGSTITDADLATLEVIGDQPAGSFTSKSSIVGRVATAPLSSSQIVLSDDLSTEKSAAGVASLLRDGTRAISVRISDDQIVGGFLRVNDHVDILAILPGSVFGKISTSSEEDQSRTTLLLQNVEVLAVGTKLQTDGAAALKSVQTVTLAVTPEAAARISLAERLGKLKFAIRNPGDNLVTQGTTVALPDLEATSNQLVAQTDADKTVSGTSGRKITVYSGAAVSTITVDR